MNLRGSIVAGGRKQGLPEKNKLRGAIAGGLGAKVIYEARRSYPASRFDWLCRHISYQPKGRIFLPRKPREVSALQPQYVHQATTIERDIDWSIAQLFVVAPDIDDLSVMITEVQMALISGDRRSAFAGLEQIEIRFGMSIWGLEAKLALTQVFGGLEAQKQLKADWTSRGLTHAALYVALMASERNEEIVSYPNFVSRASSSLASAEAPIHWQRLIRFRVLKGEQSIEDVQDILRTSASISVIDLYDALVWSISLGLSKNTISKCALTQRMFALKDPAISRHYAGQEGVIGLLIEAARQGQQKSGWAGLLVENFRALLDRSNNVESADRVLTKVGTNFDFLPLGRALRPFVIDLRERSFPVLRQVCSVQHERDRHSEAPHTITRVLHTTSGGEISYNELFKTADLGDEALVLDAIKKLSLGDVQDRVTGSKMIASFYFRRGQWIEALRIGVDVCVERSGASFEVEFDQYLSGQSWQELSRHADNPDLCLGLFFASKYTPNQASRSTFERYLQYSALAFLNARGLRSFEDIGRDQSIALDRRIFLLSEVFTSSVMEIAPFIQSSRELAAARIAVCRVLAELDTSSASQYSDEIKELTYRVEVQDAAESFDQSRVHVDIDQIKQRCAEVVGEDFARYISLHDLGIVDTKLIHEAIASLRNDAKSIIEATERLSELPKTDADNLLLDVILRVKREYLFNADSGLDAVLSLRVRHGSFTGYLRGALEEAGLITSLDSATGLYKENLLWIERLGVYGHEARQGIAQAFSSFSKEFDGLLRRFVDERVQVRGANKPSGLVDASITSYDFNILKASISAGTTIAEFLNAVLANFEQDVRSGLDSLKIKLDSELRLPIESLLTKLRRDIVQVLDIPEGGRLLDAIASAGTNVANNIDKIKGWFVYASQRGQLKPYSMAQILEIAMQVTKNIYPTFRPNLTTTFDAEVPPVGSGAFRIADALIIALENVHKHSGKETPIVSVSVSIPSSKVILLRVKNEISGEVRPEALAKVEELRGMIDSDSDDTIVRQEGGTGLLKLWRMSGRRASERHASFGFERDTFCVEFTIPVVMQESVK